MNSNLSKELRTLQELLTALHRSVLDMVAEAVKAVIERDSAAVERVIASERLLDSAEVKLETHCLSVLARYQPMVTDLRFIVSALKINYDLERIGDIAENIARRARALMKHPPYRAPFDLNGMAQNVSHMLDQAIGALTEGNAGLARSVRSSDGEVDEQLARVYERATEEMRVVPDKVEILILYVSVARNLEQIADLAASIAEDVLYMVQGEIVRHSSHG